MNSYKFSNLASNPRMFVGSYHNNFVGYSLFCSGHYGFRDAANHG